MDLESSLEHGWDENLLTWKSDLAFPEDISDMLFEVTMRVQMTRVQRNTCQVQVIKKKVTSNIFKEFYFIIFDLHTPENILFVNVRMYFILTYSYLA